MKCNLKTQIYSRVVGYYSPTNLWNKGKKEEYKQRKTFKVTKITDRQVKKTENEKNGI